MGNGFMWSSLNLALPENLQRRLQVLAPTSQQLPGRQVPMLSYRSCSEGNEAALTQEYLSRMAGMCVISQLCTVRGSPLLEQPTETKEPLSLGLFW